jgi:hypothetical protein
MARCARYPAEARPPSTSEFTAKKVITPLQRKTAAMHIALVNLSEHFGPKAGLVRLIANAINTQFQKHVCPAWGATPWTCTYYSTEASVPATSYKEFLFDHADQANALGYHDQDPNGMPYGRVFVETILSNGGTETSGSNSVSVTASHEALEIFGDPQVGSWSQMPDGRLTAEELCDAVENDSYQVSVHGAILVSVSNFLLPQWFDTNPENQKFDFMGTLSAPFTMSPGGYLIVMKGGKVSQVFGDKFAAHRGEMKKAAGSRTSRRLLAVA